MLRAWSSSSSINSLMGTLFREFSDDPFVVVVVVEESVLAFRLMGRAGVVFPGRNWVSW